VGTPAVCDFFSWAQARLVATNGQNVTIATLLVGNSERDARDRPEKRAEHAARRATRAIEVLLRND
jgi:hypothetical protein